MSIRIQPGNIVVRVATLNAVAGAFEYAARAPEVAEICNDGAVISLGFVGEPEQRGWIARMRACGVAASELLVFDSASEPVIPRDWVEISGSEAWLREGGRGELAPVVAAPRVPFERHQFLSRSESGLHFVRERKSGVLRQLTDAELADFSDPAPCAECGEQFGCDHFNVAGEPMLSPEMLAGEVPKEWLPFAREYGLSRNDLERLRRIESVEGEFQVTGREPADVRTQELAILLNEAR